jgi:hypothetical protein
VAVFDRRWRAMVHSALVVADEDAPRTVSLLAEGDFSMVSQWFDFSMVSAEKYSRGTAVRWLLIGDGMRAIELANLEN